MTKSNFTFPCFSGDTSDASAICAIVPCFNEGRSIFDVVVSAREHLEVILVVDDGSRDATAGEARRAGATVLSLPCNQGKGAALKAGFAWALAQGFRAALTLDGDGQHDTREIPDFIREFDRGGCGIVIGNRMNDIDPMPRVRLWSNRISSWVISRLAGLSIADSQCGYRLVSMDVWKTLSVEARRYEMESEILIRAARHGVHIAQIPVRTIYFASRQSKIHPFWDSARLIRTLWRCRKA